MSGSRSWTLDYTVCEDSHRVNGLFHNWVTETFCSILLPDSLTYISYCKLKGWCNFQLIIYSLAASKRATEDSHRWVSRVTCFGIAQTKVPLIPKCREHWVASCRHSLHSPYKTSEKSYKQLLASNRWLWLVVRLHGDKRSIFTAAMKHLLKS